MPTWLIAALGLIVGFGVADFSGIRALGGVVLVVAILICALSWLPARGVIVSALLVLVFLAAFVISHPLGGRIGAWPSVFLVSAAVAAITYLLADSDLLLSD